MNAAIRLLLRLAPLALAACAATAPTRPAMVDPEPEFSPIRATVHRGDDDLLTAGLGLAGLRAMAAPAYADPDAPTPAESRRRAIWSNWRGIADLVPAGGYGSVYGSTEAVPGREFSALATVPGARHPHRVLLQLPDAFDLDRRCVLVAPASGSRGVYGAIAVAGAWGLPRGCAVVYTDKAAGSDYFDLDAGLGFRADGTPGTREQALAFAPDAPAGATGVAVKHAHSQDNPEADWGRHVRQAAQFALHALDHALPDAAPFDRGNTRIIAVGISNGGGAVLRAAELDGGWFDAVVAGEPNVHVEGHGGRSLYDYSTQAALLMPCALLDVEGLPASPMTAAGKASGAQRCASLAQAGTLPVGDVEMQARVAHERLRAAGWSEAALHAGAVVSEFDIWRAIAVTYASTYGRYGVDAHPCGYAFAMQAADGAVRPATAAERAVWLPEGSGIPPSNGVGIVDPMQAGPDPTLPGLQCLRALWSGEGADAERVHAGVHEVAAAPPRADLPMIVVHGTDDGLIPPAFSSAPYVAMAREAGRDVRYWQVGHVQHFDAFLALPDYGARYLPLLPYVYAALDGVWAHLFEGQPLPADARIQPTPRGDQALTRDLLALPAH